MSDLVHCHVCGLDAYPSLNMDEHLALVPSCPKCGAPHAVSTPPQPEKQEKPKVVALVPRATPDTPRSDDPVVTIKARLAFLDEELLKLDGYNKERRRLRRMLKAAGEQ